MRSSSRGSRCRSHRAGGLALVLGLAVPAADAPAHVEDPEHTAAVEASVASHSDDPAAWIARARLRQRRGDAAGALADLERAEQLGADRSGFALERGLAWLALAQAERAEAELGAFLAAHPDHAVARASHGRALAALGRHAEAARELERALDAHASPTPDLYLERARALLAADAGDPGRALASLDEARIRLGALVALEGFALELERSHGRLDAALVRVERLAASSPRPELWWVERAEILERAGRPDAAARSLRDALRKLETLPTHRRTAPAIARLTQRARAALERLDATAGATP